MAEVQVLYLATADGIAQLVNPGTSHRWRAIGTALDGQDVRAVRASAIDALQVYAGTPDGLYVTHDGGSTWELDRPDHVTALAAAQDGVLYAGTESSAVLRGGVGPWTVVHQGDSPVIYLGALPGDRIAAVYRSGEVDLLVDGVWARAQFVVPCASQVVASLDRPHELFITNNTGVVSRPGVSPVPVGEHPSGALVLLAGKPEALLIGTAGRIYRSDDGGNTVTAVDGPEKVRVLVSPPRYQDYAYAGTEGGELWLSTDRGRSWQMLRDGLAPVRDLTFARVR